MVKLKFRKAVEESPFIFRVTAEVFGKKIVMSLSRAELNSVKKSLRQSKISSPIAKTPAPSGPVS